MYILHIFAVFYAVPGLLADSVVNTPRQICGKSNPDTSSQPITPGGIKAGEYPWYASLYSKGHDNEYNFVCGGTIVSPRVILTAAHCTNGGGTEPMKPNDLKVAVGKYRSKWDIEEKYAQKIAVQSIIPHPSYKKSSNSFSHDSALLVLANNVELNDKVQPACLNWNSTEPFHKGDVGTVVSQNRPRNHPTISDGLRVAKGSYLDAVSCLEKLPSKLQRHVTEEKFCINYVTDPGLTIGDSGAGVTFEINGLHYLAGVTNVRPREDSSIVVFINVARQKDWIQSVIKNISSVVR